MCFFLDEEKLTVDNCLCDACFRHVDRRANVPSYGKRSSNTHLEFQQATRANSSNTFLSKNNTNSRSADDSNGARNRGNTNSIEHKCVVSDCRNTAAHTLRRKCISKRVKRFLANLSIPSSMQSVRLCKSHYESVIQCSGCILCKRRLSKSHMFNLATVSENEWEAGNLSLFLSLFNGFLSPIRIPTGSRGRSVNWACPSNWVWAPPSANCADTLQIWW